MEEFDTETGCDPALLSCVTTEEIQSVLPYVFVVFGAVLIWRLVRHELRKTQHGTPRRGAAHGQGQSVTNINMPSHGRGRDHMVTIRHTKDSQEHARAMMPDRARRKDKP